MRQMYANAGPMIWRALCVNLAAMNLHDGFANREPQSRAASVGAARRICPIEAIEDVR